MYESPPPPTRPTLCAVPSPPLTLQADRECLEHIVYDFGDTEMMNAMRPSIEEAQPVQTQELALDYIGEGGGGHLGFCLGVDRV